MSTANELLRRAMNCLLYADGENVITLSAEIQSYLTAEPEAEPLAFIQPNHLEKARTTPFLCRVEPEHRDDFLPLYTTPEPAMKPLNGEEILRAFEATGFTNTDYRLRCFIEGVRFAENHHWISSSIPSLNDTINADSDEVRPLWLKKNETLGWRGYFDVRGFDRMYGDVFDSEEECMARTPTATGYQRIVIELPEEDLIDEEWENEDE